MSNSIKDKIIPEDAAPRVGSGVAGEQGLPSPFEGQPAVSLVLPAGAVELILSKIDSAPYSNLRDAHSGMYVGGIVNDQYTKFLAKQKAQDEVVEHHY